MGGDVVFDNVVMRYSPESEPALKGLSFTVGAGEKVAVVGRSGAGKTTITLVLFRLRLPDSGAISIGGVDTRAFRLQGLRAAIAYIPQENICFSGMLAGLLALNMCVTHGALVDCRAGTTLTVREYTPLLLPVQARSAPTSIRAMSLTTPPSGRRWKRCRSRTLSPPTARGLPLCSPKMEPISVR